jgi:ribosomal protein S18 acetylase RimI-like enzyme
LLEKNGFIIPDSWLSEVLGMHVCKLKVDDTTLAADHITRRGDFLKYLAVKKQLFAYAKVPVHSIASIAFLEDLGFHLVDTNITFEKHIGPTPAAAGPCTIRSASNADEVQTVALASRAFRYSRFHLDHHLAEGIADRIKAQWVKSYFAGQRGDAMIVAETERTIIGFLQLIQNNDESVTIDLIGVDTTQRRRGIASALISFAEAQFPAARRLRVGTQLANSPSLKLYEHLGFRLCDSQYVFHFHSSRCCLNDRNTGLKVLGSCL